MGSEKNFTDIALKLRSGKKVHDSITVNGIDLEIVVVSADRIREIEEDVNNYATNNASKVDEVTRNRYFDAHLVAECLRNPNNLDERVFNDYVEAESTLDTIDIDRIVERYGMLLTSKAPKLELITQEELDSIKKFLEETPLSDLNTVSLVHLSNFHQTMHLNV